jgi:drug/metabolite transporter (DMT)-like permease
LNFSTKTKGYFALGVTSFVWGTTWIVAKLGVAEAPALQLSYIRQFIGGSIFVLFFLLYKKLPLPSALQFRWLFIMSIILFVSANGLSTWGVRYIPSGLGALIGALYPLCVVILERVFFKSKKLTTLTMLGLGLGIIGIAFVFYENAFTIKGPDFLLGISLSVIAMLSWSIGTIFIARNKVEINPYYGVGWQMLISSVILFVISQSTLPVVPLFQLSQQFWLVIGYLVLFGSLGAFIAFIYSLKKLPASIASLYAYINPIVAMLGGYIFLKEKLSANIFWGSLITLSGVFLVNYSVKRSTKIELKDDDEVVTI